ncbi:hypothetical protein M7I_2330 [Glarea lozoyensis 74030]|uniref:Uncharacterized protein n=1 Tax=Glarea lozoyensis (strain ATCC 74030 / MF5533) TaxID=1104152 RepID=H0EIH5_GLAL7|nr:hypothetical protein M7I_2330 [Glarea lozoyensis 74030]
MAGPTTPPKPGAHAQFPPVRPLYRFMATGLGASMWFFDPYYWVGNIHGIIEYVEISKWYIRLGRWSCLIIKKKLVFKD